MGAAVGVGEGAAARVADKAPNLGGSVPGLGTIARVDRHLGGGVAKVNGSGGADSLPDAGGGGEHVGAQGKSSDLGLKS